MRRNTIRQSWKSPKKKGACSQKYLQEKDLAAQLKARLKSVAICDEWTQKMLKQVLLADQAEKEQLLSFIRSP